MFLFWQMSKTSHVDGGDLAGCVFARVSYHIQIDSAVITGSSGFSVATAQLESVQPTARRPMTTPGRVLVIDDSESVLERVKARLKREFYEVTTTSQPVGVSRHLLLCDLVILDFHMPGLNGAEVLKSMKMLAAGSGARPMYFLYTSDKVLSRRYRELGFDGAMSDKGDDEALVRQVAVALRLARLRRMPSAGG
jgi:two-component system, OmpR family, response regulator